MSKLEIVNMNNGTIEVRMNNLIFVGSTLLEALSIMASHFYLRDLKVTA